MGPAIIEQKVRERFSGAAAQYDALSGVHREIAAQLISRVDEAGVTGPVLDVGMGTGWFTRRLTEVFPGSAVVGVDFADGMIACARMRQGAFRVVQAHACALPFTASTFGLLASNMAYQWVTDLPRAFAAGHACLKEGGHMVLTMSGRETFRELFASLRACIGKNEWAMRHFADTTQVVTALEGAGFRTFKVEAEQRALHFPDTMALIRWVKAIGANALPGKIFLGRDLLKRVNAYYREHFSTPSGIFATFEVIWVEAGK